MSELNWYTENWDFQENDYYAQIGERWDQISQKVYGRPDLFYIIIQSNLTLSDDNKQGLSIVTPVNLKIPDLDLEQFQILNVPEWRLAANATES